MSQSVTLIYFSRSWRSIFEPHQKFQLNSRCQPLIYLSSRHNQICQKRILQILKQMGGNFNFSIFILWVIVKKRKYSLYDTTQSGKIKDVRYILYTACFPLETADWEWFFFFFFRIVSKASIFLFTFLRTVQHLKLHVFKNATTLLGVRASLSNVIAFKAG